MSALLEFLEGEGLPGHGLTIDEILASSNDQLERDHQFIQWVFPNRQPSRFNWSAPVLTEAEIEGICQSGVAAVYLRRALARMRKFYSETDAWMAPKDHNHLRITRILEAAALLLGIDEARRFLHFVEERVSNGETPVS
ncbi:hypothetical protein GCM10011367_17290 [Marinicauda pacifica]|uniref:opioid growth factor receptor-related protein n=1 Tax=Marinicauda pacifica TaxID=1133559 RepID=UPI0013051620|nr:opioid growth factor receptor-related protein [Marinicauda pacifica]GGE43152.1 hypothetical protein GCM10011367_17290 [Marinicauda pacifica]